MENFDILYRLVLNGPSLSGKSQIVGRYTKDSFDEKYIPTQGCDFVTKIVEFDQTEDK